LDDRSTPSAAIHAARAFSAVPSNAFSSSRTSSAVDSPHLQESSRRTARDRVDESRPGVELDVIAAAVIGGTSLRGGEGSVIGTLIGAAIMAVVRNAFVLLGLPLHLQVMIIGVVILLAVGLDRRRRR
jgi:hypothetical protein